MSEPEAMVGVIMLRRQRDRAVEALRRLSNERRDFWGTCELCGEPPGRHHHNCPTRIATEALAEIAGEPDARKEDDDARS